MLAPDHPNKPSWWDRADDIFIWIGLNVVLMSPALTALCFLAFLLQFQGSAVILCFIKETVRSPLGCCQLRLHPLLLFCARSPPGYYMQRNNAEKSNVALPQCHNVQCHNREKSNVAGSDGSSWHLEPAGWLLAWNHKHKLLILIWNEAAGWVGRKPQTQTDFEDELVLSILTLAKPELLNEKLDMPERISFLTLLKRNTDALKRAK